MQVLKRSVLFFVAIMIPVWLGVWIGISYKLPIASAVPGYVFIAQRRPEIATLQEITAAARDDQQAIALILAYYKVRHDYLADVFNEQHEQRLQALYTMYILHISHIYGKVERPASALTSYIREQDKSHCGIYPRWQGVIMDAFGIEWRIQEMADGYHGWLEARIDGKWEIFDSTINVWIDHSGVELQQSAPRVYKALYSPVYDQSRPDAYADMSVTAIELARQMPGLGLWWPTRAKIE